MFSASDLRAMRRALDLLMHVDESPAEFRAAFEARASTVRLATEIAVTGGVAILPADPADSWIELMAHGFVHGVKRGGAEQRLDAAVMETFRHFGGQTR